MLSAVLSMVTAPALAAVNFIDVAPMAGLNFTSNAVRTFPSVLDAEQALIHRSLGNGAAVGDYDKDGDLDIYLLGHLGQANALFRNNLIERGTKTFTNVTPAVLADTELARVAHFVDLDNDFDLDLIVIADDDGVGTRSKSRIYRNDGNKGADVTETANFRPLGFPHAGCSVADYDGDGLLDIYVTNWGGGFGAYQFPGSNRLYRNLGDFRFQDVTEAVNLGGTLSDDSFTAIFTDFDEDGDPDLHVAIDHTSDASFRNDGGVFVDVTQAVGTTHTGNDMGVATADYDNDGDLDMYLTNITDPTGELGNTQGNVFYQNQLNALSYVQFTDVAFSLGVDDTYWGWGTEFVDVENDGDLDIVAVTGFDEFILEQGPVDSPLYKTPSVLFLNDGTGHFARFFGTGLDTPDDSRSLIAFDYDRDGDQDLLVTNHNQPVRLFENVSTEQGNWLVVKLSPDNYAINATAYATSGGVTRRRDVIAGRSYLAGTPSEVHFGLGAGSVVDTLRIEWADGHETILTDVAVNQILELEHLH